jgi:hypothetical protein
VSYTLNNKHGTRAQYQNMVTACHNAGVQVLAGSNISLSETGSLDNFSVDIIFNHMAGVDSGSYVIEYTKC